MLDQKIATLYTKPLALYLLTISLIFLVEFFLMEQIIPALRLSVAGKALVDAGILAAIITPALYWLFFSPLRKHIHSLKGAKNHISQLKYAIEKSQELGHVGTWNLDIDKNELIWTDEVYRIFGIPLGTRLTYEDFLELVHPNDKEYVAQKWQAAKNGEAYDIEHRLVVNDSVKWVREKANILYDCNGRAIKGIGFVQDVTEFKELKEKAIRAGQLASVGEISTMIAHEVNNPLSGIIGYAEVFKNRACEDCRDKDLLGRIIKEGDRISRIVSGLLAFTRKPAEEKKAHDIEPIIVDALNLLRIQFDKNNISLALSIRENLPQVHCNAQQIEQVVLNIIRNAYQAVQTGTLEGEAERIVQIEAGEIELDSLRFIQIRIANNGPNIPEHLLSRIKEPFFTTKPIGIGTGLGLSISNDIMKEHNGHLEISSPPGQHTEMVMQLPVVDEA